MVYCAVAGCNTNNNKKSQNYSPDFRYFSFPTAKKTSNLWVQKCQRHNFNTKNARICSKHFSDEDFRNKEKLLQLPKNKWKLKDDAVPLLNLAKSPKTKTSNKNKRNERIKTRDLVKNIPNTRPKLKADMELLECNFESSLVEDQLPLCDFKTEPMDFDELVIEEKPIINPIINPNEIEGQNKCSDNTIIEEIKHCEEDKEHKFHIKDETIDDIDHEDEEKLQKYIKTEDLIIKHEEDNSEETDVDICSECTVIVAINDNPVLKGTISHAAQTVPKGTLALNSSNMPNLGIYTQRHLKKGVRLGPYEGNTSKVESTRGYSWKLNRGRLLDASDETCSNYLRYVNYAKDISEQNLEVFQCNGELYYRTSRDIEKGEELLVCFDDNLDKTYYEPQQENFDEEFYICQFCQLGLKFENHRDRHQMFCKIRPDRNYVGSLCKHFAVSSEQKFTDEGLQIEPVKSAKEYNCDISIYGKNLQYTTDNQKLYTHGISFDQQRAPNSHLKDHRTKDELTGNFNCPDCDFATHSKKILNSHQQKHSRTKIFKCAECDYETHNKSNLNRHIQKHDLTKTFKCLDCDYATSFKSNLYKHIRKHNPTKMLKCADCDYVTSYKSHLNEHRTKHELTNEFKCADCDYETHNIRNLNKHRQKQNPTQLFKCADCDYKTCQKNNLIVHRHNKFKCAD